MNSSRRVVRVRVPRLRMGVATVGVALALAGCSATNPATVATPFDPADGRNAQIGGEPGNGGPSDGNNQGNGGIKLRNFLMVSHGNGEPGVLVGAVLNDSGTPAQLTLTVTTGDTNGQQLGTTTLDLPPGAFVQLGNPAGLTAGPGASGPTTSATSAVVPPQAQQEWFQVNQVPVLTGTFLQLSARTPKLGGTSLDLPVLPPQDQYASITPTPVSASATSSTSPTPSASP
ncbi:MAG TPA: hypothetical protein VMT69_03635 [Kineosporiaceae bacterium]|nr:hypothetical protein [Kineosporiaceae bacterium]